MFTFQHLSLLTSQLSPLDLDIFKRSSPLELPLDLLYAFVEGLLLFRRKRSSYQITLQLGKLIFQGLLTTLTFPLQGL